MSETPRTDAAMYSLCDGTTVVKADVAREIERELARAMRVVGAARRHAVNGDSGANLFWHVTEWEAGR